MKLVRLADDRYILDAGPEVDAQQLDQIQSYFIDWWAKHTDAPTVVVIGGNTIPLEYEDRREPDIESRLRALEEHVHITGLDYSSGPKEKP